ncbi:NADPH-dependent FMN reductase [Staphylococcus edaphicus]|uniref:FMN-dependent NADPH-azoreductase n=1 Tax=Staphylococcus edaphicus TaxID=1955013 RepID=A0A2C6WHL7_9STAP|nr:NADPH-dependent FMN reductase [Staphylococcus edaphicus]PHK48610.1 FMN reductase [Staphylococcus edaphicus]UQW81703.1 NAD(P)H-dependent oxidoreductase [Staphylococcus edaphicus]
MNIVLLSGSTVGSKTSTAMKYLESEITSEQGEHQVQFFDLKTLNLSFSDGRNYLDYTGDTLALTTALTQADIIFIGFPIFQASIPGTLKNVFDLLPVNAFRNKVIGIIATAGSPKHYLIPETQLKPILGYMKAHIMQTYVFIEERDFSQGTIVNDDILFRLNELATSTLRVSKVYQQVLEEEDDQYDF